MDLSPSRHTALLTLHQLDGVVVWQANDDPMGMGIRFLVDKTSTARQLAHLVGRLQSEVAPDLRGDTKLA